MVMMSSKSFNIGGYRYYPNKSDVPVTSNDDVVAFEGGFTKLNDLYCRGSTFITISIV